MKILLWVLLLVAPVWAEEADEGPPVSAPLFPALEKALDDAFVTRKAASFAPVSAVERKRFADAFGLLVQEACDATPGTPTAPVVTAFDGLGFRVTRVSVGGDPVWGVFEQPERRRGAGMMLVRGGVDAGPWKPGSAGRGVQRVVVLAPHPRTDRGSERIAQRLFGLSRARALLQASVTRMTRAPDGSLGDVAHRTDSFFQVATEVLEARATDQLFLQVHGFELKRHEDVPKGTQAILSDANDAPRDDPRFTAAAGLVKRRHALGAIALWGEDVKRLGGLTNSQAQYINPRGRNIFMHCEMSAEARRTALADTAGVRPPQGSLMDTLLALIAGR